MIDQAKMLMLDYSRMPLKVSQRVASRLFFNPLWFVFLYSPYPTPPRTLLLRSGMMTNRTSLHITHYNALCFRRQVHSIADISVRERASSRDVLCSARVHILHQRRTVV